MKTLLKFIILVFFVVSLEAKSVEGYYKDLTKISRNQSFLLAASYYSGRHDDLGLTLAAIVWKESSFGVKITNSRDGKFGSFGVAQILLETAMVRNNIKTKKGRKELKLRLISDVQFNLQQARLELKFWRKQYRDIRKNKYWFSLMLASYNAGWKNYGNPKGKAYAEDVKKRIQALKLYFKRTEKFDKVAKEHLLDIQRDLKNNKVI